VYGVLTTAQAASQVPAGNIALSLALYLTLYAALLSAYVSVVFYLAKKAVNGGEEPSVDVKGLSHV
jgi:cytochrome d ubiquinol oxidase subunit I